MKRTHIVIYKFDNVWIKHTASLAFTSQSFKWFTTDYKYWLITTETKKDWVDAKQDQSYRENVSL